MKDGNDNIFRRRGGTIYLVKILTKTIKLFINPYDMDISCNIRVFRVPKGGYTVKNGVHPHFT